MRKSRNFHILHCKKEWRCRFGTTSSICQKHRYKGRVVIGNENTNTDGSQYITLKAFLMWTRGRFASAAIRFMNSGPIIVKLAVHRAARTPSKRPRSPV